MDRLEASQDPGSVQKIMDQGIDRDQLEPDLQPFRAKLSGADQNPGQRHSEHFVRDAVDIAQWLNQSIARLGQWVRRSLIAYLVEAVVDPANQIPVSNVPNKQVETVGNLVEMAVSQAMGRKRAGGDVVRLGAGPTRLLVSAAMKSPIGLQLWATWSLGQILANCPPGRLAMAGHVVCSNLIRNSLKTEVVHQPVKQCGGVMAGNGGN